MNLYSQRTKTLYGYFIQSMSNNRYSSTFVSIDNSNSLSKPSLNLLSDHLKIEASTHQGILVCVAQRPHIPRYYVCKPCTKEWQVIPNPKTRYFTERTAMMVVRSNPLHYKIIRFSQPKSHYHYHKFNQYRCLRCEIFYSKIWAWKQLKEVKLPYGKFFSFKPTVSACGSLHWLTSANSVFAFHEDEESYSLFSLPQPFCESDYSQNILLIEYEGKLALVCMQGENLMELWVMENYDQKVWNKRCTISIASLRKDEPHARPLAFFNADIALMKGLYNVTFFNFRKGKTSVVRLNNHVDAQDIFPFRSDFEPCNLRDNLVQVHSRDKPIMEGANTLVS